MKNKGLFILAIAAAASFTACDFLSSPTEESEEKGGNFENVTTNTNNPGNDTSKKEEDTQTPSKDTDKQSSEDSSVETLEESEVELQSIVDTSKDKYSVQWKVDNQIVRTDTNVSRGEYIEADGLTLYPKTNKVSNVIGKNYVFKGWSREAESNKVYKVDQLSPVVRDTTYYAQFELADAYKLTLNFKIFGPNGVGSYDNKAANYDSNYKLDIFYPKDSKIVLSDDILDLFPTYKPLSSDTRGMINLTDYVTIDLDSVDKADLSKYAYTYHCVESGTIYDTTFQATNMPNYEENDNNNCYLINNLPEIKSNLSLNIFYKYSYERVDVKFMCDGDQLWKVNDFVNTSTGNPAYANVGAYASEFASTSKIRNINPVRVKDGKKYAFKGWSLNPNASPSEAKDILSLNDNPIRGGDLVYYAIFSSTEYTPVCLYAEHSSGESSKAKIYSWDELVNKRMVKMSDGSLYTDSSAFAGQGVDLTKGNYPKIYLSLPGDKGIKSITKAAYSTIVSISLPSSLESLTSGAFNAAGGYGNDVLATVCNTSTKLKTIPMETFSGIQTLTTIEGFDSVTTVGEKAFFNCPNLRFSNNTINFQNIGSQAFANGGEEAAFDLKIGSNVRTIEDSAFANRNIYNLTFAEGVTTIKSYAFSGCQFKSVSIPASLTNIYGENTFPSAFNGCNELETVSVNSNNPIYYSDNNSIVKKDGNVLIQGTKGSTISSKIKRIGGEAFKNSALTKLRIPKTVEFIEKDAFNNSAISRIDYEGTMSEFIGINHKDYGFTFSANHELKVYCSDGVIVRSGR